jgi:hypothetical protein
VIREFAIDERVDFEDLFWKVRSLDAAYLKHQREKAERERELEQRRNERSARANSRRR